MFTSGATLDHGEATSPHLANDRPTIERFCAESLIARQLRHQNIVRAYDIVGTHHYMVPEVLRGEIPDARSDIYALEMVAFEILAGKPAQLFATARSTTD